MIPVNKIRLLALVISLIALSGIGLIYFIGFPSTDARAHTGLSSRSEALERDVIHPAGPFKVQVALDPEKPRIGNNQITLIVHDDNNRPVADAAILAVAEMPAMGAMAAMAIPIEIENMKPGLYQGRFELPMDGA